MVIYHYIGQANISATNSVIIWSVISRNLAPRPAVSEFTTQINQPLIIMDKLRNLTLKKQTWRKQDLFLWNVSMLWILSSQFIENYLNFLA